MYGNSQQFVSPTDALVPVPLQQQQQQPLQQQQQPLQQPLDVPLQPPTQLQHIPVTEQSEQESGVPIPQLSFNDALAASDPLDRPSSAPPVLYNNADSATVAAANDDLLETKEYYQFYQEHRYNPRLPQPKANWAKFQQRSPKQPLGKRTDGFQDEIKANNGYDGATQTPPMNNSMTPKKAAMFTPNQTSTILPNLQFGFDEQKDNKPMGSSTALVGTNTNGNSQTTPLRMGTMMTPNQATPLNPFQLGTTPNFQGYSLSPSMSGGGPLNSPNFSLSMMQSLTQGGNPPIVPPATAIDALSNSIAANNSTAQPSGDTSAVAIDTVKSSILPNTVQNSSFVDNQTPQQSAVDVNAPNSSTAAAIRPNGISNPSVVGESTAVNVNNNNITNDSANNGSTTLTAAANNSAIVNNNNSNNIHSTNQAQPLATPLMLGTGMGTGLNTQFSDSVIDFSNLYNTPLVTSVTGDQLQALTSDPMFPGVVRTTSERSDQGTAHFVPDPLTGYTLEPQMSDELADRFSTGVNLLPSTSDPNFMLGSVAGGDPGVMPNPMQPLTMPFPPQMTMPPMYGAYDQQMQQNMGGDMNKPYPQDVAPFWGGMQQPQGPFGLSTQPYDPMGDGTQPNPINPQYPNPNMMPQYGLPNPALGTPNLGGMNGVGPLMDGYNNPIPLPSPAIGMNLLGPMGGPTQQHPQQPQLNQVQQPMRRDQRKDKTGFHNGGGGGGGGAGVGVSADGTQKYDLRNLQRSNVTLMDLVKHELVEKFARDQHGSRFIQTCLENATSAEKEAVFAQIETGALSLCEDVFGNYVVQKFFEHGSDDHKIRLARILMGRVLPLTKSMYGCRVVQKAFECVSEDLRVTLIQELKGFVEECVRDQNGNHVIQKCIEEVPVQHLDFILETFQNKVYEFSTHPYGCRVIQRLLERCSPEQNGELLHEVLEHVGSLSKDQYGNYVVQHVIEHGPYRAQRDIVDIVCNHMLQMAKHKFSSNVVEKCFIFCQDSDRDVLLDEILGHRSENPPLVQMVRDQYGNYVIQKILEVANVSQRNRLVQRIMECVPNLRKLMFGKHIIAKIERVTGKNVRL